MTQPALLTIDVEDWFHLLDHSAVPGPSDWADLPSRVESGFRRFLEITAEEGVQGTCFFLGWVAERHPELVQMARAAGHEIASHGYLHRLAYEAGPKAFREDAIRSRCVLEDLTGEPVRGYRAAGFSLTAGTPWFYSELLAAGYSWDSSLFPTDRGHGGMVGGQDVPHRVTVGSQHIDEIPVSISRILGRRVCLYGGGYLRLFPYSWIRRGARRLQGKGHPVLFYIHPRELDPEHPRLDLGRIRNFKCYVNLRTTEPKLRSIMRDFDVMSVGDYLANRTPLEESKS